MVAIAREITPEVVQTLDTVKEKLVSLMEELFRHDGYGQIQVDIRILKRNQKEIILRCGKEYRYVINYQL